MSGEKSDSEQLVFNTDEQIAESVTVSGPAQPNDRTYYQILAGDDLQVTFDNNGDNNYWSFHAGSSFPHVSASYNV
ncbi:hypothetical protein GBAR_LOCUS14179 [Geodia barretti]|uniref:Uncharacterized protein n=1 Tax=Geodia barretti TaxID=519541 RepID=A0AA35WS44_GEOBA|nr:hypothetical protein GBAR_LOCUS14179 [Geodia barretti]